MSQIIADLEEASAFLVSELEQKKKKKTIVLKPSTIKTLREPSNLFQVESNILLKVMNFWVFIVNFESEAATRMCYVKKCAGKYLKIPQKVTGRDLLKFKLKLGILSNWKIKKHLSLLQPYFF